MAVIDLKNATIRVKDGYSKTGAVNNAAGYTAGQSTIAVDGFTGTAVVGDFIRFAGDNTYYEITAKTDTLGALTQVTISPVLVEALIDNQVATVGPHLVEAKLGEGNLTYSEKRKMEYVLDRGRLDTVKEGDQEPVDVRMDFTWEFLRAATADPPTLEDALKQRGNASSWVSSSADPCEPYAVDIEIEYAPPCGGYDWEIITLADFRWEDLAHDLRAGQVSVTGKCNITQASVTRVAA